MKDNYIQVQCSLALQKCINPTGPDGRGVTYKSFGSLSEIFARHLINFLHGTRRAYKEAEVDARIRWPYWINWGPFNDHTNGVLVYYTPKFKIRRHGPGKVVSQDIKVVFVMVGVLFGYHPTNYKKWKRMAAKLSRKVHSFQEFMKEKWRENQINRKQVNGKQKGILLKQLPGTEIEPTTVTK